MCMRNDRFVLYADRNVLKCRRGKYIMGVAMTVRTKWQFCILFNVRILQTLYSFYNTYHISSLMTITGPSRCIYLPLQLLAKKALQVSKIYHKFKTKHFNENPHVEIVKKCILYPQQFYWSKHLSVLLKGLSNFSSFVFLLSRMTCWYLTFAISLSSFAAVDTVIAKLEQFKVHCQLTDTHKASIVTLALTENGKD